MKGGFLLNVSLLEKFKESLKSKINEDSKTTFMNIFEMIKVNYLTQNKPISEDMANEIIELGDFIFGKDNLDSFLYLESIELNTFKSLYFKLKKVFNPDKDFFEECDEILCSLKVNQVREVETFYKAISRLDIDMELKISYRDGVVYKEEVPINSLDDNMNVLRIKSFIARAVTLGAVFLCDFINIEKNEVTSAGFVFNEGVWLPLKESFIQDVHKNDKFSSQKYISLPKG